MPVAIDPNSAPVRDALALRYSYSGAYGDGGKVMLRRSDSATERAPGHRPRGRHGSPRPQARQHLRHQSRWRRSTLPTNAASGRTRSALQPQTNLPCANRSHPECGMALALDPDLISAVVWSITKRTDRGDISPAYAHRFDSQPSSLFDQAARKIEATALAGVDPSLFRRGPDRLQWAAKMPPYACLTMLSNKTTMPPPQQTDPLLSAELQSSTNCWI